MNRKISQIVLIISLLILGLIIIQKVLASGGNSIGNLFLYLGIFGFICGVIKPKVTFYGVIVIGFYLDLMKRFLVVETFVSQRDLIQVLALAPITFAGILIGQFLKLIMKEGKIAKQELMVLLLGTAASSTILVLSYVNNGGSLTALAQGGAQAAYVLATWLSFYYLKTRQECLKFFNFTATAFIPVAAYAYWQLIFGYSDIEYDYALSGLTIVQNPLLEGRIEYYRIFSTMSSSGAYGMMAIIVGTYCLVAFKNQIKARVSVTRLYGLLCLASLIPGAGRTGWAMALIILLSNYAFRKKASTVLLYSVASAILLILFTAGDSLIEKGGSALSGKAQGAWSERALTVGTFTSRTDSIKNWTTDPTYFSWFGLSEAEKSETFIHDMLGEVYVSYGIVFLVLVICLIIGILVFSHRAVFKIKSLEDRSFVAFVLAVIFSLLFGSIISGGGIRIFPVVFYFWCFVGMVLVTVVRQKKRV